MKITDRKLREIIKEAVMNEILLQNHEGGAPMRSEADRLREGMTEALRTYLTGEGGIPQTIIGDVHMELDEHISAMVDIIMQYMKE